MGGCSVLGHQKTLSQSHSRAYMVHMGLEKSLKKRYVLEKSLKIEK